MTLRWRLARIELLLPPWWFGRYSDGALRYWRCWGPVAVRWDARWGMR